MKLPQDLLDASVRRRSARYPGIRAMLALESDINRFMVAEARRRAVASVLRTAAFWGGLALLLAFLTAPLHARAQPAGNIADPYKVVCPPIPEPTSAALVYLPAGCVAGHEAWAMSMMGYLRVQNDAVRADLRELQAAPPARALPSWAWALIAAAGTFAAPVATCEVGEACGTGAQVASAVTAAAGALTAALVLD